LPWFDKLTTGLEEIGAALAALVLSLSKDAPHALSCLAFEQLFAGWRVCQACAARPFFYE